MKSITIAGRNTLRQRRRTIFTVVTMLGGFVLSSFSIAWSDGTYSSIIEMFTRNRLGHIQIHAGDYLDNPSLYKTIDDSESIESLVRGVDEVEHVAARLYSAGLASVGSRSAGTRIIGIDPEEERIATRFERKILSGRYFSAGGGREALLGKGLARNLRAEVGDTLVLLSQAADGSIANDTYIVVGTVESGDPTSDMAALFLRLSDAQELLALENRVHEIAVVAGSLKEVPGTTRNLRHLLDSRSPGDAALDVSPWQEFAHSFYTAMKADQDGMWISLLVIMLVVAVGVLNTVLMSVLERRREYGLLRALGTRPRQIVNLVLLEVAIMALACVLIGGGISYFLNLYFSHHGIPLPATLTYGGVEFTTMSTEINLRSFLIPAVVVFLSALLVSLYPALKAARTPPAVAMRMH